MLSSIRNSIKLTSNLPRNSSINSLRTISNSTVVFNSSETTTTKTINSPKLSEGEQSLKDKLELNMQGSKVEVQDVSGGCGTFYAISIAHSSFKGLSMIKQHRIVNDLLKEEIKGMHGLQLKTAAE